MANNTQSVSRSNMRSGRGSGGGRMMMSSEKPRSFKTAIKKLLKVLLPHKLALIAVIFFTIGTTIVSIINPRILGDMTNVIVDDYIAIRVYDAVSENLPDGFELPAGTTISDLPKAIESAAMSGQIDPSVLAQLTEETGTFDTESVPGAQQELIMNLDLSTRPAFQFDKLANIGLKLFVLILCAAAVNYICSWVLSGVIQRVMQKMRRDISEKINRMPIRYFDKHPYGDTLSRVTNDVDTIGQSLNQTISQALSSVVTLVGVMIMLISISWVIAVMSVVIIMCSGVFVIIIAKRTQKYFTSVQENLGDMNGYIEENYSGHIIIKAFSAERRTEKEFNVLAEKIYNSSWKSQFFSGLMMPIVQFIGNLGYVGTVIMGGYMAINGRLSIGDIQAAIQYVNQLQNPVSQVAQIASLLQSTAAASERVFDFLEEPEENDETGKIKDFEANGAVEFDNVSFGYNPGKIVIKNLSFKIKPGDKVAIVGPTGAGKTTLVNLLMRFYEVNSGEIKIDGVNTQDMKRSTVREQFGMVLQDTWLMSGTIYENLAYGDLEANRDQIKTAAKAAHVDHFVRSLPKGYDTVIDENSDNISTGEKQLLTIARAMLANPPMLILDEATSNVDTRTEMLIQQAMERLTKNRTSFVIAHRLSTIKNSDLILVMDEGRIVEQGNHKELLKQNGFYAKLYNSQFSED